MNLTSIDDALRVFHNQFCKEKYSSRQGIAEEWQNFIKALSDPISKHFASRAMAVDIVTRTALYESNPPNTEDILAKHPDQVNCEQDIIAVSLRNRIAVCKKKQYGCNHERDLVGAAMTPSMYNIWADKYIAKTDITACFLKDKLQTVGEDQRAGERPSQREKSFKMYRESYKKLAKRTQKILGYDQPDVKRASGEYLSQLFDAEELDGKVLPKEQKLHYLKSMMHYYHRGGLGKCNAAKRVIDDLTLVEINKDLPPGRVRIPYKGEVLLKGGVEGNNNPIFKLVDKNGPSNLEFVLDEENAKKLANPNQVKGFDCLPEGYPPECSHVFEKNSYYEQGGKLVPRWITEEADKKLVEDMNFQREPKANAFGKYLKVTCKNPEYGSSGRWPTFGGKCSEMMRLFSEVDREQPVPLPAERIQ